MIADKEISSNARHDGILALMWFASLACSPCVIKHGIAGTKGTSCAQADICKRETVMPPNAGVMAVYSVNAVMKVWTFQYIKGFSPLENTSLAHATDVKAKDTGKDEVVYGVGIELCHMF